MSWSELVQVMAAAKALGLSDALLLAIAWWLETRVSALESESDA